jgi:ribosome-associated translation inhibitor RaiA
MIITFNTDHNIHGETTFTTPLITILLDKLERYSTRIRKVEVHLTDENAQKKGSDDKRCLLEAHINEMEPVVGTDHADTYEKALAGAIQHLKAALDKKSGREEDQKLAG